MTILEFKKLALQKQAFKYHFIKVNESIDTVLIDGKVFCDTGLETVLVFDTPLKVDAYIRVLESLNMQVGSVTDFDLNMSIEKLCSSVQLSFLENFGGISETIISEIGNLSHPFSLGTLDNIFHITKIEAGVAKSKIKDVGLRTGIDLLDAYLESRPAVGQASYTEGINASLEDVKAELVPSIPEVVDLYIYLALQSTLESVFTKVTGTAVKGNEELITKLVSVCTNVVSSLVYTNTNEVINEYCHIGIFRWALLSDYDDCTLSSLNEEPFEMLNYYEIS